jgi:beta-galactosidase
VGPQQTLYVPGCWLKKGVNEIVVFEQLNDGVQPVIPTVMKPVLTDLKAEK